jgi:serralysin
MNADGTPKPTGTAIHNLATLLADTGTTASTFNTGTLSYTLGDTTASDNAMVMQQSDGSHWMSLRNKNSVAPCRRLHSFTCSIRRLALRRCQPHRPPR